MSIDPKKIAEWKDNPPGCDCCPEAGEDCFCEAREALPALLSDREEMLALLREVEWGGEQYFDYGDRSSACPLCEGVKPDEHHEGGYWPAHKGHKSDCRLAAFLKET